jgi:hypothetical protein
MDELQKSKPADDAPEKEQEKYEKQCENLAQLAEKAERYEDMCAILTLLVESKCKRKVNLSNDERNLLSVAFKNVVGALRSSWRTFGSDDSDENGDLKKKYSKIIEQELEDRCKEVLSILEDQLLPAIGDKDTQEDTQVFYLKMGGDYYRYLAEFRPLGGYGEKAKESYKKAMEKAEKCLPETHPTRLGLALNFSVCYYEILKEQNEACALAKKAFDGAIQKLDTLNDANYKDSTLIMQLLRDNLTLWTTDNNDEERED